ncbi:recombination regulator RecX [Amycolatopsis mediterranei S699]|uniref:Regulatory protein RecX n=2 Tax=Amycolatopsis mediterranei TaxID=33910 RepID=RECX_AMYMU|nr:regulatory protein RecX [Amycolatopsis mediterranei]Q9REV5.2 RecName: Full=Regulatory protein RecX [Amycolatopsis mediterranei U32]ADJ44141.1 recombination regulator RecX [Amycolatopsis mediterranei U32]AEK40875.1 recombination regulator RecX [Amycolatopsis mediterranei S699]AFO75854.1 recombination regulator RecX [Amycolatopsis mediterranei S699]AGT82983.1 recombination regulator RecX [Amycolatopsis mediterranei RB]KDO06941.1 recombinase RecX [Amycolatopsis mediterranei]
MPPAELPPEERYKKAKEICFDLLAVRARTQEELRQALRRKGFDEETSETLLGKLDRAGLVNDAEFAELWVKSRHTTQGLSRTALMAELRRKGVDDEVAAQAAGEVDRESEEQMARELVRKRLGSLGNVDEQTALRRLLGFLARKGYPQGLAYTVIKEELREYGAESTLLDDAVID